MNNFKEIILEDGTTLKEFATIKEIVKSHFEELYTETEGVDPIIT
jgi:hypothetical protein